MMRSMRCVLGILTILSFFSLAGASTGARAYDAMGIDVGDVLSGTALTSKVLPGGGTQVVCLVTYLTGKRDEATLAGRWGKLDSRWANAVVSSFSSMAPG